MKELLSVKEAAELLSVHPNTIGNMVRRGELAYYKIGRQIRIDPDELEKLRVPANAEEDKEG